jgi:hypothetical protein
VKIQERVATRDKYCQSIIVELKGLKAEEHRLHCAYPKLRRSPMLMTQFWADVVALRNRAERLEAFLDPVSQREHWFAAETAGSAIGKICA